MDLIFWALIAAGLGTATAAVAKHKGADGAQLFLWWIAGAFLFIIALPAAFFIKPEEGHVPEDSKKCAQCAELVKKEARKCRLCGFDFTVAAVSDVNPASKNCPGCNGLVLKEAVRCRHCGHVFRKEARVRTIATMLFLAVALTSAAAQEFNYQFQDRPTPDANVMVVSHSLRQGYSGESYIVGRVFNRGLRPARNVRVVYEVRNRSGIVMTSAAVSTAPEDVPATSFASFDQRIPVTFDPRDYTVFVKAEWSK